MKGAHRMKALVKAKAEPDLRLEYAIANVRARRAEGTPA